MKKFVIIISLVIFPDIIMAGWEYDQSFDKMRNQTTYSAHTESTNKHSFNFPYQGGTTCEIVFRNSPRFGKDVMLRINKGQFMCSTGNCIVYAKFDNDTITKYHASSSSDADTSCIFISPCDRFSQRIIKAKRLIIEANFFHEGNRQFEFDVDGLIWK